MMKNIILWVVIATANVSRNEVWFAIIMAGLLKSSSEALMIFFLTHGLVNKTEVKNFAEINLKKFKVLPLEFFVNGLINNEKNNPPNP